jgi:hypothetical protein
LYLYRAGDVSLWYDEAFSLGLVREDWGVLWTYLWGPESNMTLYYLLLRGWLRLAAWLGLAPIEWVARLPSIIFGALSVVVVFLLARRWSGRLVAVVAAGLYATNWLQLSLAPQARSYSLELLLVCISWYAFLAGIDSAPGRKRGWWAAYAGAAALAVYAHLFSIFVLAAQLVAFAALSALPGPVSAPVRRQQRAFISGVAAAGIVILPLAADAWLHGGAQLGIPPAHLGDLHRFFTYMGGKNRAYAALVLALTLLAALAAALPHRSGRRAASPRPWLAPQPPTFVVPLLAWLVVPLALSFGVTQPYLNLHVFFDRYLVVVIPPLCLLTALGVAAVHRRAAQVVVVLALVAVAWPQVPQSYAPAQDFRTPARWLQQHFEDGDGLVCFPDNAACAIPMEYYLRAYPGPAHFSSGFPGSWSWERHLSAGVDQAIVVEYAARHPRIFFLYAPLEVTDPATALRARALQSWLDERYPLVSHSLAIARTSTIAGRLYTSRGTP